VIEPRRLRWKRRIGRATERRLVNPIVRRLVLGGRLGSTYAVLETTGRRSGIKRRTPVANGLRDDTFWLISAHGRHAHYVHNLLADPRVRIGIAAKRTLVWRSGRAEPQWLEDARARQRQLGHGRLGYRLDAILLRANATDMTTVRIALLPKSGDAESL
jgi:deazaflavin-dependent oxidoreductase (nitroreductase family)